MENGYNRCPLSCHEVESYIGKNYYSVISAGTEGKTVKDARLGYIGKAKARQKEFKQVLQSIRTNGLKDTYDIVMNKLEAPSPLGYSGSGLVIVLAIMLEILKREITWPVAELAMLRSI